MHSDKLSQPEFTLEKIRQEIVKFKNDPVTQKLLARYKSRSMAEIMGVSRKEIPHSNFIAWLFSTEDHGELAIYNLLKFLEILSMNRNASLEADQTYIFDSVISDDLKISDVDVYTEKSIGQSGRVDIFIGFKYIENEKTKQANIIIENKVTSSETGDQTDRYYRYFEKEHSKECNIYTFLTPAPSIDLQELEEPECQNKNFIQINYQSIVDFLLEPLLRQSISEHMRKAIQDYLLTLSQPYISGEEHTKEMVMAIGEQERDLLNRFWKSHQTLLYAALDAIANDPELPEEDRKAIRKSVDEISKSARDTCKINILYKGKAQYSDFKKADIGYYVVQTIVDNNLLDESTFQFLKADKTCRFDLLKTKDNVKDTEKKYRKYRVSQEPELIYNGEEYYIARNWGRDGSEKFANKISKRFKDIHIEFID